MKNGLKRLKVIVASEILALYKKLILSERIRKDEINRNGKNYWLSVIDYFRERKRLILPYNLREELRKPLGEVFSRTEELINFIERKKPEFIFSVGDIVSYHLIKNKITPDLMIFDYKTKRGEIDDEIKKVLKLSSSNQIVNQAGLINKKTFITIKNAVEKILIKKQKQKVFVLGEEDLLVLPMVLFSPLNSLVLYGHFKYGVVGIRVDEGIKKTMVNLLKKFSSDDFNYFSQNR